MPFDPAVAGKALAARLREIEAAIDRYAAFAFTPGEEAPPLTSEGDQAARQAADEVVLRALRVTGDRLNFRLLRRLSEGDAPLAALAEAEGLPRLVLWERLNDLVQAGLAGRAMDGDRAGLTPAGHALVELVEETARAVTAERPGRGR